LSGCGGAETGNVAKNEAAYRGSEEGALMSWKTVFEPAATSRSRVLRRLTRLVLAGLCVAGLTACAIHALQYDEPADDQAAELLVSTDGPMALLFFRDAARCTDALQVPQPKPGSTSYKIPVNREFAFKFFYFGGPYHLWAACPEEILSFYPDRGKQYRLHYTLDRDRQDCHWTLTENDGGRETPVKATEREHDPNFTGFAGEGLWCKAKAM
jgi:hypothetical protein